MYLPKDVGKFNLKEMEEILNTIQFVNPPVIYFTERVICHGDICILKQKCYYSASSLIKD